MEVGSESDRLRTTQIQRLQLVPPARLNEQPASDQQTAQAESTVTFFLAPSDNNEARRETPETPLLPHALHERPTRA
jgi:hypothetical protein